MTSALAEKIGNRFLLEDLGVEVGKSGSTTYYEVHNLAEKIGFQGPLPSTIHVVDEPHGKRLCMSPMVHGTEAGYLNRRSMRNMVSAMRGELLPMINSDQTIGLIEIPRGGDNMGAVEPLSDLIYQDGSPSISIPRRHVMKLRRRPIGERGEDYATDLLSFSDDGRNSIEGDILLLSDYAIASGETLRATVILACEGGETISGVKIKGQIPRSRKILGFLGVCSMEGLSRVHSYCLTKGIEFIPVLSTAIYQVTPAGQNILRYLTGPTDLPFFSEYTVTTEEILLTALRIYGQGRKVCVAGDTGNRFYCIEIFLLERLIEIQNLEKMGTPIPIEQPEWRLARALLGDNMVMYYLPLFHEACECGEELPEKDMEVVKKQIMIVKNTI